MSKESFFLTTSNIPVIEQKFDHIKKTTCFIRFNIKN